MGTAISGVYVRRQLILGAEVDIWVGLGTTAFACSHVPPRRACASSHSRASSSSSSSISLLVSLASLTFVQPTYLRSSLLSHPSAA